MPPTSSVGCPPLSRTHFITAAAAPLRICRPPSRSTPLIRVCAVNATKCAVLSSPGSPLAQPVRGLGEDDDGASLGGLVGEAGQLGGVGQLRVGSRPATGRNSAACRLPSVMVPVLSSSSVFTSPAASTARPDMASTLCCTSRSMPAMPIADSSAPIVVGIRQTSSATSTIRVCSAPE